MSCGIANLLGCLRPSVEGGLCIALLLLILVEKGDFLKLRPLVQKLRQKGEPRCHDLPQSCIVALGRQAEAAVEKFLDIRRGGASSEAEASPTNVISEEGTQV